MDKGLDELNEASVAGEYDRVIRTAASATIEWSPAVERVLAYSFYKSGLLSLSKEMCKICTPQSEQACRFFESVSKRNFSRANDVLGEMVQNSTSCELSDPNVIVEAFRLGMASAFTPDLRSLPSPFLRRIAIDYLYRDRQHAAVVAQEALDANDDPRWNLAYSRILIWGGKTQQALDLTMRLLKRAPNHSDALYDKFTCMRRMKADIRPLFEQVEYKRAANYHFELGSDLRSIMLRHKMPGAMLKSVSKAMHQSLGLSKLGKLALTKVSDEAIAPR